MADEKFKFDEPTSYWKGDARFEAFHARVAKRRNDLIKAAGLAVVVEFLHVIDNDAAKLVAYVLGVGALFFAGRAAVSGIREKDRPARN